MATDRESLLADFQACTGIDDVGEAICHLEQTDWNLVEAVNRVLPQGSQTLPSENTERSTSPSAPMEMDLSSDSLSSPASSRVTFSRAPPRQITSGWDHLQHGVRQRTLNFNIDFRKRTIKLKLHDSDCISKLKDLLHAEVGIPPCQQDLRGWRSFITSDSTRLSSLNLPTENSLYLIGPDSPMQNSQPSTSEQDLALAERLGQIYILEISVDNSKKKYSLQFSSTTTVGEVKQAVYTLTSIPVSKQDWQGWPPDLTKNDTTTLGNAGLSLPKHDLTVKKRKSSPNNDTNKVIVDIASDSSGDEFEDAPEGFNLEDDIFIDDKPSKVRPMMPEGCSDEMAATIHFSDEFASRYGPCHPMFFQGSLDEALQEALIKPAKERKLLAVYLHHDSSVLANVFCTQLLCSEAVVNFLTEAFIVWGWDLTNEANKCRLLSSITEHFGSMAATTIRSLEVDKLPVILIITRTRATTEVFSIINGSVTPDELLSSLMHSVEIFTGQREVEAKEEAEREAREQVKREQDEAYQASLRADKAKEEVRREEEKEKQRKEEEDARVRVEEERERVEQEAFDQAVRESLETQLPAEPPKGGTETSELRFRVPGGEMINRRFHKKNTVENVLNFLYVKGYPPKKYKLLTSYPRRDLTTAAENATLESLKLYPQETLTLEER